MQIAPFETEHFFARYEFNTPYQLCNSDCETMTVEELLQMAGIELEMFGRLPLGYTETEGDPVLREAIADSYTSVGADEVLVLGSPVEGIYLTAQALLDPEDEVVVLTPAYDALVNVFEHIVGRERVKKWTLLPDKDTWVLDLPTLLALISDKTKLLVVNFPHNPTGYLPTLDELHTLTSIAAERGVWIFYDEMYFGLIHSGTPPIPSAADIYERAIVLSGLSKTHGLPGLRAGWLVVRDSDLRAQLLNWKFYTSICPPAPTEFLAEVALAVQEQLRARNIAIIEQNLALAEAFFGRWSELFVWRRPLAGSTGLVRMNVPSVTTFAEQLVQGAGVLIQPAVMLGTDDHYFRMGFGREAFGEALQQLDNYLQAHRGELL